MMGQPLPLGVATPGFDVPDLPVNPYPVTLPPAAGLPSLPGIPGLPSVLNSSTLPAIPGTQPAASTSSDSAATAAVAAPIGPTDQDTAPPLMFRCYK